MTDTDPEHLTPRTFLRRVDSAVSTLNPGYFALTMATGIVSVAIRIHGLDLLAQTMAAICGISWVLLTALTVIRIARHRPAIRNDFKDPRRGFGYFTFTAASGVLGTVLLVDDYRGLGIAMLVITAVSWFLLGYIVPWTAVLHPSHRPTLPGANGTWFIWVVGGQSLAVLAATLEPMVTTFRDELGILAVFSWAVGCVLYAGVALLVAARLMLYPLGPEDAVPAYWISMGATAITVLAGSKVVLIGDHAAPMVRAIRELAAGTSVIFWVFGTWLIPVLLAAGYWRHVVHRLPLRYDATLWSIIFPLGMYSVASHFLGSESVDDLPLVQTIAEVEAWVALAAWAAVFISMCVHLFRTLILGRIVPPQPERPYIIPEEPDPAP
ncbi:tellurite resistance/C4-dicarboxylate transporter family protein [Tomitella gaofuii]|uniref:tellurite resistance/C4-dicarboxylate transporter family protein n=1 Tax=Tomitella gaofuii TaxID=2760083 RepID=UPI001F2B7681|nr:tellurite resistance/C4-dicarboxylate transporter family protein [Tomitella gaofuii]